MYAIARLESGGEAGALDQPSTHCDQPRIPCEVAEADPPAAVRRWPGPSAATIGSSRRSTRRVPSCSRRGWAASWKQSATCKLPSRTSGDELIGGPLYCADLERPDQRFSCAIAAGTSAPRTLGNAPTRSSRRSSAIASPTCVSASCSRSRSASACEYRSSPIGRERKARPATLDQALAELNLERSNLLRNRRLRERERHGRVRERSPLCYLPEGEKPPRVQHR